MSNAAVWTRKAGGYSLSKTRGGKKKSQNTNKSAFLDSAKWKIVYLKLLRPIWKYCLFLCSCAHIQIHVGTSQMWPLHSPAPKRAMYNLCSVFFIFNATLYICKYNVMCFFVVFFSNRCAFNLSVSTLLWQRRDRMVHIPQMSVPLSGKNNNGR